MKKMVDMASGTVFRFIEPYGYRYECFTEQLDKSLLSVIGGRKNVVIYGYDACGYNRLYEIVKRAISEGKSSLEGCYNWRDINNKAATIDGHCLTDPDFAFFSTYIDDYKTPLIKIVLENCKRMKEGKSIIPVIFCVKTSLQPREFSAENAKKRPQKSRGFYRSFTGRELNLSYKLCNDPELSEEIRDIAKRTFIFVKTNGDKDITPTLVEDLGIHIDESWDTVLRKSDGKKTSKKPLSRSWRAWMNEESKKPLYSIFDILRSKRASGSLKMPMCGSDSLKMPMCGSDSLKMPMCGSGSLKMPMRACGFLKISM